MSIHFKLIRLRVQVRFYAKMHTIMLFSCMITTKIAFFTCHFHDSTLTDQWADMNHIYLFLLTDLIRAQHAVNMQHNHASFFNSSIVNTLTNFWALSVALHKKLVFFCSVLTLLFSCTSLVSDEEFLDLFLFYVTYETLTAWLKYWSLCSCKIMNFWNVFKVYIQLFWEMMLLIF